MEAIECGSSQQINEDYMFETLEEINKDLNISFCCRGEVPEKFLTGQRRCKALQVKDWLVSAIENGVVLTQRDVAVRAFAIYR